MKEFKQRLTENWHLSRWIRLGAGLFIGFQAIQIHDGLSGLLASFFLLQAFTNTGCCGFNSCATPAAKPHEKSEEVVHFEEIKEK